MSMQLIPTAEEFKAYQVIAEQASKSGYFNKIGGAPGLFTIALYARELGLPPMQMLCGGMHNIMGKIEIAPVTMNAMIRKAGHMLKIVESSDQKCTIKGVRCDTKEDYACTYSIDDAKRAGLVKSGSGWEKFPSDMLFARCLSRIARRLFPDVIGPSYVEGEISEASDKSLASTVEVAEIVESAPVADKVADPIDPIISSEDAKILDDMLVGSPEILDRLLKGYKIDSLSKLKAREFPVVKARLDEIFKEISDQQRN